MADNDKPLFDIGLVTVTPGVIRELGFSFTRVVRVLLTRHMQGDWGDLSEADARENFIALESGNLRIMSRYAVHVLDTLAGILPIGQREVMIWVITEADRSATTLLLPDEY